MTRLGFVCTLALLFITAPVGWGAAQTCDVLVYGATPSGVLAAVAAARGGARVVLIEPTHHVGGMTTGGLSSTDVGNPRVIGGLALEFFQRAARFYNDPKKPAVKDKFMSEPHAAEQAFNAMLHEAGVDVVLGERLDLAHGVKKDGPRIISVTMESGKTFAAKVYIDASYEGDLMAHAGVKYVVGRESRSTYDEPLAGYFPMPIRPVTQVVMDSVCSCLGGDGPHYVHGTPAAISGVDAAGQPLFGVERAPDEKPGDADDRTQSYNFRLIVTRNPADRVAFPKPAHYDPSHYALLLRLIDAYPRIPFGRLFHLGPIPNEKFDLNAQGLFSTDYPGHNTGYPDGDYAVRKQIWQDHLDFTQGLFWFLGHDSRVPKSLRDQTNQWGLCKDEFVDNGYWPYQLYVREARRMVGEYVMTQRDLRQQIAKPDGVAMGSFLIDCHIVRRIVLPNGDVTDEGSFQDQPTKPYQIPYRSLVPIKSQCSNLLAPVCLSASHVACCSIRMEPQYMMLGEAAGAAAAMAAHDAVAVQDIDVPALRAAMQKQGAILSLPPAPGQISSASLPGVVADDEQAQCTGDWILSPFGACIDGSYHHDGNADKGYKSARFELKVPTDGMYEARLAYVAFANRASNVPVTIESAEGQKTVSVNERKAPPIEGHFVSLGRYRFSASKPAVIVISNSKTDGYVVVDAVQLVPSPASY